MMNSADLVAKLLATENLTVVRTNSKTAYFDVKSRVLNLPLWKDMTPDIEGMLIGHEVGHALYTDGDEWVASIGTDRIIKGYVNVVEDARIEKLMKRRYPGIRKTFNSGYKQLIERDFFKIKDRDISKLIPIDKINMYFKVGYSAGIKFNATERQFINQIERVETFEEVVDIAKAIYEYSKTLKQDLQSEADDDFGFNDEDGDFEYEFEEADEYDEEGNPIGEDDSDDEGEEEESSSHGEGETQNDADLESQTDRALQNGLEELADDSIEYRYYELFEGRHHDPIVPFKQIISETACIDTNADAENPNYRSDFDSFMLESERMVGYLVKEFEMRKSAQAYKRAKVSKSGSLNMNKLHAYQLNDDIFKRITMLPNGKNHGMIFLLDWSGSMGDVILPTVKQVVNLAMFCRRIQIPFEVYAFSGTYYSRRFSSDREGYDSVNMWNKTLMQVSDKNIIWSDNCYALLNLFSSKMTHNEFKTCARRFTTQWFQYAPGFNLGDTPLNEALADMVSFIPQFKKANNVEKLTFITLTDGQGGQLNANKHIRDSLYVPTRPTLVKVKNILRDKATGKEYELKQDSCTTTEALLRMIKDRYAVTTLGFYIVPNRRSYLDNVYLDHFGERASYNQVELMRKDFKEIGFSSLKGTGRDDLFIIPDTSTKIVDQELELDGNASAAAIARKFGKMLNTKRHSRVLLDRFIGYVA